MSQNKKGSNTAKGAKTTTKTSEVKNVLDDFETRN